MTTPVQQGAVDSINKQMTSGFFSPVTHGNIKAVADKLGSLNTVDADAVIDALAGTGKLDAIAAKVVDGKPFGLGGLSDGERGAFFQKMASTLDGHALAELSRAFGKTDSDTGGAQYVGELGRAIATHASPDTKIQFIAETRASVTDKPNQTSIGFGSTIVRGDADAVAAGTVLGSMRGAQAQAAFASLNPQQLRAVMDASIADTSTTSSFSAGGAVGSATTHSWDASAYGQIMTAAASMPDAAVKARVFDAGAGTLREVDHTPGLMLGTATVGRDRALAAMTQGLTRVLDSDTTGITRNLAFKATTIDGSAMSTYTKQMLGSDAGKAKLGEFMVRLQFGNGGTGNAVDRLNATVTVPGSNQARRENAGALGYFTGSVYKGAEAISSDVKAQQALTTAVLKSGLTLLDKFKVGGAAGPIAASVAKEWVSYAVNAAIQDPGNSAAVQLERAALPVNPQTQELGVGDDVRNAFNTALSSVQRQAKP